MAKIIEIARVKAKQPQTTAKTPRRYICDGCPKNQKEFIIIDGKATRNPAACCRPCKRLLKQLNRIHKGQREMSGGIGTVNQTEGDSGDKLACEIDIYYHGNEQDPVFDDGVSSYLSNYWTADKTFRIPFLSDLQNDAIRLFYFEGMTYKDIARKLSSPGRGIDTKKVENVLYYAKKKILKCEAAIRAALDKREKLPVAPRKWSLFDEGVRDNTKKRYRKPWNRWPEYWSKTPRKKGKPRRLSEADRREIRLWAKKSTPYSRADIPTGAAEPENLAADDSEYKQIVENKPDTSQVATDDFKRIFNHTR